MPPTKRKSPREKAKYTAALQKAKADGDVEVQVQSQLILAVIADFQGEKTEAAKYLDDLEEWGFANARAMRRKVGIALLLTGILNSDVGRYAQAERCLEKSYQEMARVYGAYNMRTSFAQGYLGSAQLAQNNLRKAKSNLKDAVINLQLLHFSWTLQEGYIEWRLSPFAGRMALRLNNDYINLLHNEQEYRTEGKRLAELRRQVGKLKITNPGLMASVILRQAVNSEKRDKERDAEEFFRELIEMSDAEAWKKLGYHVLARQHLAEFFKRVAKPEKVQLLNSEIAALGGNAEQLAKRVAKDLESLHLYSHQYRARPGNYFFNR